MEEQMPLPIELVLHVIDCSLPAPGVILDPSHSTTRTLIAFTLVCHETRRIAARHLRKHCVFLDSGDCLNSYISTMGIRPEMRAVTSLLLAPFHNDIGVPSVCRSVKELLNYTCETLTKLVIDIPLRSVYPRSDHLGVRYHLRYSFESLINLREFVSTQDELYLDVEDGEYAVVWSLWPKLKRLALWNVDADERFWRHIAKLEVLETLVLSSPDSLGQIDPKAEYFRHTLRSLRVIVCIHERRYHLSPLYGKSAEWTKIDPERNMSILTHYFPGPNVRAFFNWDQQSVKRAALDNTLWGWGDAAIRTPMDMKFAC